MGAFQTPLAIQTPQPRSPLTSIGALMQLRGQMSEIALHQAQVEQAKQQTADIAAQAEQRNRDLGDQNKLADLLKDPAEHTKAAGGDYSSIYKLGVQPKIADAIAGQFNSQIAQKATAAKQDLENHATAAELIGKDARTALYQPDGTLDLQHANDVWSQFLSSHAGAIRAMGGDISQIPKTIDSEDHLNQMLGAVGASGAAARAGVALQEGRAKATEAQAKADIEQFKANALKGGTATPESIAAGVRGMSVFQGHPQEMQDAIDAANAAFSAARGSNDPLSAADKAQEAVKGIADRLRVSSPGVVAGKVAEARAMIPEKVEEQSAMIPGEVKRATQTAYATIAPHIAQAVQEQAALAKNAPGAFSGIIEPTARRAAESQYDTATSAYVNAASTAQDLKNLISAAQGGNKAAAAMVPLSEIRSFVNRVNATELRQSAGAGSLLDNIQGKLGKLTDGQPIPPEILNQTKQLADMQIQNASRKYDAGIAALTQKGANPKRVALPGMVEVKAGGITHVFTSDAEASAFEKLVKDHGGTSTRE